MNSRNQFFFQRRTLLSAALGAAAFSAIGTPLTVFAAAESDPAQQLDRIKKAGVIRIGTEGVFVPYSYHDEQGRLTGYDVELARAVAAKIGVQAQFIESSWDSLLAGVDAGRFDIVVNQVEASAARRAKYDFSVPLRTTIPQFWYAATTMTSRDSMIFGANAPQNLRQPIPAALRKHTAPLLWGSKTSLRPSNLS